MIKVTSKSLPRVHDTEPSPPRVEAEQVREALGADASNEQEVGQLQGPVALFGLRQGLAERLRSTEGRPWATTVSGRSP